MKKLIVLASLILASILSYGQEIETINRGSNRNVLFHDTEDEAWDKTNRNDVSLKAAIILNNVALSDSVPDLRTDINDNTNTIAILEDSLDAYALDFQTGDLSVTGAIVTSVLDYDPPHGAMAFSDSAIVVTLSQNVWNKVTGPAGDAFVVQDADNITIDGDTITIITAGDYIFTLSLSFSGTANDVFEMAFYKNAVKVSVSMSRKTSNTDTGNMGLPAYIEDLVAGDDISIYIRNTGDNDDATLISGSLVVYMLHPD